MLRAEPHGPVRLTSSAAYRLMAKIFGDGGMRGTVIVKMRAWANGMAGLLCLLPITAWGAAGEALNTDTAVSTVSAGNQNRPAIASAADGRSVIAWTDSAADGSGSGVYARRYLANGEPAGPVFALHTSTTGNQDQVRVAMQPNGLFAAVWRSDPNSGTTNPPAARILVRLFDPDGAPLSAEVRVDSGLFSGSDPAIAADGQGRYTAVWTAFGVDADAFGIALQRVSSAGALIGGATRINNFETGTQSRPRVACGQVGQCTVAWQSFGQDGDLNGIYARRIAADGSYASDEFAVNELGTRDQNSPAIAMHPDGAFLIAWTDFQLDGDGGSVAFRRYAANGTALESPRLANLTTTGTQSAPSVAVDASSQWLFAWQAGTQDGDGTGIVLRAMASDGTLVPAERVANSVTAGDQNQATATVDADGDVLLAWNSVGQDGDGDGVYQRRFVGPAAIDLSAALTANSGRVRPGGPLTLTATTNNLASPQSPSSSTALNAAINAANNVSARLTLPAGASTSAGTGTRWTCTDDSGEQSCTHSGVIQAAASSAISFASTAPTTPGDYTYSLTVSSPHDDGATANNTASRAITVAEPTISYDPISGNLGEAGGRVTIAISLEPAAGTAVSLPFSLAGTATANTDYSLSRSSPIPIPAGTTALSLEVTGLDDNRAEGDETLEIQFGNPSGAALNDRGPITFTLQDDEPTPVVQFETSTTQINENGGQLTIRLSLSGASENPISLPYTLAGTGSSSDYQISPASPINFAAGQSSALLTLTPSNDNLSEDDETVVVDLAAPSGATLGTRSRHTALILDDERRAGPPQLRFEFADSQASEDSGTATVRAILSRPTNTALTVPLSYSGTATSADYSAPANLSFSAGSSTATLTVNLVEDTLDEAVETVIVNLQATAGITLSSPEQHTLSLIDNDPAPTVDFVLAEQAVREGARTIQLALRLSAASGRDIVLGLSTDGTAQSGLDYQPIPALFTIPAGSLTAQIPVQLIADGLDEATETLVLGITSAEPATVGSTAEHRMRIEDSTGDSDSGGALPLGLLIWTVCLAWQRRRCKQPSH